MSPDEFRAAFDVFVESGPCTAYEFVIDQGFTKRFARRVVDSFECVTP